MDPKNEAAFHQLVGRALYDSAFRARLMDPGQRAGALAEVGFAPTSEQAASLERTLNAVQDLSRALGLKPAAM